MAYFAPLAIAALVLLLVLLVRSEAERRLVFKPGRVYGRTPAWLEFCSSPMGHGPHSRAQRRALPGLAFLAANHKNPLDAPPAPGYKR